MSTPWFVDLPGFAWERKRTTRWNSLVQVASSGLESRAALYTIPRRGWVLPYSYLREGNPYFEVEALEGFFNNQQGQLSSFFLWDQYQCAVGGYYTNPFGTFVATTPGYIATGDGITTSFQAQRILVAGSGESGSGSSYSEPVFCFDTRASYTYGGYTKPAAVTPQAYVSGSPVSATFNVETGTITFSSAPGSGDIISAQFSYGFRCRFETDELDIDNIESYFNESKEVKIVQTRV